MITYRIWYWGRPRQWHTSSTEFFGRLEAHVARLTKMGGDIVIEVYRDERPR